MQAAPLFNDWKALRVAVLALIAAGVTGQPKAFLKAVRDVKAAALVLLFALARSVWPEDDDQDPQAFTPPKIPGPSRLGLSFRDRAEDAWRNPPAIAFHLEGRTAPPPPRRTTAPEDLKRLDQRVSRGLQVLQQILSLCDDPDAHAARLKRRLDQVDAPLIAAEVKAFAVKAKAKARRTREARRLIDETWRGRRRRRESG